MAVATGRSSSHAKTVWVARSTDKRRFGRSQVGTAQLSIKLLQVLLLRLVVRELLS